MKKKEMISLNSIFFEFEMNMGVNERIERLDIMEQYVLKGGADGCGKNTCVNKDSAPPCYADPCDQFCNCDGLPPICPTMGWECSCDQDDCMLYLCPGMT